MLKIEISVRDPKRTFKTAGKALVRAARKMFLVEYKGARKSYEKRIVQFLKSTMCIPFCIAG
ncbi:MAG: hypothetical protein AAFQ44_09495 [Pseudomonadota bacterium]